MKVSELIEELKTWDSDLDVVVGTTFDGELDFELIQDGEELFIVPLP